MLSRFVIVQAGYKLFSSPSQSATSGWRVLQLRDIADDSSIQWAKVDRNGTAVDLAPYRLRAGDVLFAPRSPRVGAVVLHEDVEAEPTAASSHFYILRPDRTKLAPEYLTWYLNHPRTRQMLEAHNQGTHMPFLPAQALRDFELPLPPLHRQHQIAAIESLAAREHRLIAELAQLNDTQRAAFTWHAAHSA